MSERPTIEVCHDCGMVRPVGRPRKDHAKGCVERRSRSPYIQTSSVDVLGVLVDVLVDYDVPTHLILNEFQRLLSDPAYRS